MFSAFWPRGKPWLNLNFRPERQKLLIEASFALDPEGRPDKAADLLEALLARYPDEEEAYLWLNSAYMRLNQRDRALATMERGVKALPRSGLLHTILGYKLVYEDRFSEGLREFETAARLSPKDSNPLDSLAEAYLITGQAEMALEKYGDVLRMYPRGSAHRGRAWAFAMLGRYPEALGEVEENEAIRRRLSTPFPATNLRLVKVLMLSRVGRYREAEEEVRQGVREAANVKDNEGQAALQALSSLVALERGDYLLARERANRVLSIVEQSPVSSGAFTPVAGHVIAGLAEVHAGNLAAARVHLESARKLYNPNEAAERWWYHCLEGEIALEAGDLMAAETAFAAGEPERRMFFNNSNPIPTVFGNNLLMRDWPARIKKARGDLLGAIEVYRKLLTPGINNKWVAVYEPRFVLEMARLYEQAGDKAAARRAYQRFADLWKNADPGLPELQEARQRSH